MVSGADIMAKGWFGTVLAQMIMLARHGHGDQDSIIHHLEKGGHKIREYH